MPELEKTLEIKPLLGHPILYQASFEAGPWPRHSLWCHIEMGMELFKVLGSGAHSLMEISSLEAFRGITFLQFCAGKWNI